MPLKGRRHHGADMGWSLAQLAEDTGPPAVIGLDRPQNRNRLLKTTAVRKFMRKEREIVLALAARGFELVDCGEQGPGCGMEFTIDAAP